MRSNYPGVVGYLLLILGITSGGVALVAAGSDRWVWAAIAAAIAIVLLVLSAITLVSITKREHHDPLEPVMTEEGVKRYERRRAEGDA